ncbi:MAG TPA: metallophosphoesterase [Blastocatellia bacterium]|nr:metallophosphoesterase [Blastocatellia bacterium]
MMKIVHVSDLHFCAPTLRKKLERLTLSIQQRLPIDLEIGFHDERVTEVLRDFIQENDPEVLLISGDITTFGDKESFDLAYQWIRPMLYRSDGRGSRTCVVVPGNHDVLQGQFASLLTNSFQELPWLARTSIKRWFGDTYELLEDLTRNVQVKSPLDIFNNFFQFEQKAGLTGKLVEKDIGYAQKLFIHPFRSVSTNPIWMNLGACLREELEKLNTSLAKTKPRRSGELHLLVLHHNPISSANVVESAQMNAYNTMPAGVQLLRTLQQNGVDLVLHGHQHDQAIAKFDFDLQTAGHAYAVGSASSGLPDNAACNLLVIEDVNHAGLTVHRYRKARHRFEEDENWTLCLERNRPVEPKTSTVRYEIKHYISEDSDGNEGELWDQILLPGSELIYVSGRKLRFVTTEYLSELKNLLNHTPGDGQKGTYVRLLISNPTLLRTLAEPFSSSSKEALSASDARIRSTDRRSDSQWIWGRKEDLEKLAADAEQSIDRLGEFIELLGADHRRRINVRISHSLLSFGATVRDADKPWGKMVVRLLPVGAIGDLPNPVIKLHRRMDRALYDHYLTHLKYLLARGATVLGEWDKGDSDLNLEGLGPNPSRIST